MSEKGNLYHPVIIGNLKIENNLFLAPVAGYSDCAFRFLCREGGAGFAYTEMVSSEALVRDSEKTELLMKRASNEDKYAIQLFGGNPEIMAKAASKAIKQCNPEIIDINAGCPVPKIVKTGAGSALTRDPEKLYVITKAVVDAVSPVPVTVKIRSGWDTSSLTWKEAAQAAYEAGALAITLHARTRSQGYEGKADWNILTSLVEFMKGKIPVFASGDIFTPVDVKKVIEQTGCSAVMFARGAMGNPFIFDETRKYLETGTVYVTPPEVRIKAGLKELSLLVAEKGELSACREMRKRFCAYSKGLEGGALIRTQIIAAEKEEEFKKIFASFLSTN